jgi:hypothetical protein
MHFFSRRYIIVFALLGPGEMGWQPACKHAPDADDAQQHLTPVRDIRISTNNTINNPL